jgi:hypothetical protein
LIAEGGEFALSEDSTGAAPFFALFRSHNFLNPIENLDELA